MAETSRDSKQKDALRKAAQAIKRLQSRIQELESSHNEPIAVVGLGCRFPGGANDPQSFWQLLLHGKDGICEVPSDRWNINEYFDPNPEAEGKTYSRWAGFLKDIPYDQFDANFFGITPKEILEIDPQQRLLLEVAWEALEYSGLAPEKLQGSKTGVFVGLSTSDFSKYSLWSGNPDRINSYTYSGSSFSSMSGRLSYFFGFEGPSIAVDTACSSSLVSVHLACQSLRAGESNLALAGGVNLILSPEMSIYFSKLRALSPGKYCRAFDAQADGYVRGEGCGLVVLKRLSDARADGDRILATIRGSAVNQDGHSNGFTAPNGLSQQEVIRTALANANLEPSQIQYLEAHGTGTPLGDRIELKAAAAVFDQGRSAKGSMYLGSVKTNIGHLEAAAGIASLIKVILCLEKRQIVQHLHYQKPSPHLDWSQLPFKVPTTTQSWPTQGSIPRAGVSSFGLSGTNSHVIVEAAVEADVGTVARSLPNIQSLQAETSQTSTSQTETVDTAPELKPRSANLLVLSAQSPNALKKLSQKYSQWFKLHQDLGKGNVNNTKIDNTSIRDISPVPLCQTASIGRNHFPYRLAVVGKTIPDLAEQLEEQLAEIEENSRPGELQQTGQQTKDVVFLFSGQGTQRLNMGLDLYESEPVFRQALTECDLIWRDRSSAEKPRLVELLYPEIYQQLDRRTSHDGYLNQTQWTQPAVFAFGYALAQLWQSWGIKPAALMGHSLGEYIAACVSGVYSLETALKLVSVRGRLMQQLRPSGSMLAVWLDPSQVEQALSELETTQVEIAAINGPDRVSLSGLENELDKVSAYFQSQGIRVDVLRVSHGFHSALMEPMLPAFSEHLQQISFHNPKIPLISNVSGTWVDSEVITTADYWCQQIRQPVQFWAGVKRLYESGYRRFVEVGSGTGLLGLARQGLAAAGIEDEGIWVGSVRKGLGIETMQRGLGQLYVSGLNINWQGVHKPFAQQRVVLPTYTFERKPYRLPKVADSSIVRNPATLPKTSTSSEQDSVGRSTKVRTNLKYQIRWQEQVIETTLDPQEEQGFWLLIEDLITPVKELECKADGVEIPSQLQQRRTGQELAQELAQQGKTVIYWQIDWQTVPDMSPNKSFTDQPEQNKSDGTSGRISVIKTTPEQVGQRLAELIEQKTCCSIVFLAGLDLNLSEHPWEENKPLPLASSLYKNWLIVVQGILNSQSGSSKENSANSPQPKLWCITRGAQAIDCQPNSPQYTDQKNPGLFQTPLWGLGRVLSLEEPQIWGGLIDLDPNYDPQETLVLINELLSAEAEDHIAYRNNCRYVGRLDRYKETVSADSKPLLLDPKGLYLVTGGLGFLGQQVSQFLVQAGCHHLVLCGRRRLDSIGQEQLAQLRQSGVKQVTYVQTDLADEKAVGQLFTALNQQEQPLKGIIHAAGTSDLIPLRELQTDQLEAAMAAKVRGGWLLHQHSLKLDLDWFVTFASIAGVWGSQRQGAYAGANAFLDSLAHYRRDQGQPALSISWGPWQGGGMASPQQLHQFKQLGIQGLDPTTGLAMMEKLLAQGNACSPAVVVADVDWHQLIPLYTARDSRPLLSALKAELPTSGLEQNSKNSRRASGQLLAQLQKTPQWKHSQILQEKLGGIIAGVTGLEVSILEQQRGFFDLGMDSLMVVELSRHLSQQLASQIDPTVIFNHPTLERLGTYLLNHLELENGLDKELGNTQYLSSNFPTPQEHVAPASASSLGIGTQDVAIIGMGCDFPGEAKTPQEFYANLVAGKDCIRPLPPHRWDIKQFPQPTDPSDTINPPCAGFLESPEYFDADFFDISPREAQQLDPQQRLLLEVSWSALEDAGIAADKLKGSKTGVFIGISHSDYGELLRQSQNLESLDLHHATGTSLNSAAGRISYYLGLQGPSLAVDTACSSSLVALHLACQSLQSGESELALAGGVNLILSPLNMLTTSQAGMLSPDGRCKTFDAAADGYGRGEGCGVVVLKALETAIRDGDKILGVIRASAVNQDGASSGLTVPNGVAQESLLREALAKAGVEPGQIDYLEAHGTGTPLGDPIELKAISAVLAQQSREKPLWLGSVKSHIGHLESAAGIAGLIKVLVSLQHEQLPGQLNLQERTGEFAWEEYPLEIVETNRAWARGERVRLAGVSSFGFSGTNAHIIVQEAPEQSSHGTVELLDGLNQELKSDQSVALSPGQVVTISAKRPEALASLVESWLTQLETHPEYGIEELAYSANRGRMAMRYRLGALVSSSQELKQVLRQWQQGKEAPGLYAGTQRRGVRVAFVLTGEGQGLEGLGSQLYETQPVFREMIDRCAQLIEELGNCWGTVPQSLREWIAGQPGESEALGKVPSPWEEKEKLGSREYGPEVLFALQSGLVALWRSWGVNPDAVLGAGVGEVTGAWVAGVLSLEEAMELVLAMGSEDLSEQRLTQRLSKISFGVASCGWISSVRGEWVDELCPEDEGGEIGQSKREILREAIERAREGEGDVGEREYSELGRGLDCLVAANYDLWVEVGPSDSLIKQLESQQKTSVLPAQLSNTVMLPSLSRDCQPLRTMLCSGAQGFVLGCAIDWCAVQFPPHAHLVPLPTYPFQRHRFWPQSTLGSSGFRAESKSTYKPLLGRQLRLPLSQEVRFESDFNPTAIPYLDDHRLFGTMIVPAASHISMMVMAMQALSGDEACVVKEMFFPKALMLEDETSRVIQLILNPAQNNQQNISPHTEENTAQYSAQIISIGNNITDENDEIILHGTGWVCTASTANQLKQLDIKAVQQRCSCYKTGAEFYESIWQLGYSLGSAFKWIGAIWKGEREALCQMKFPPLLEPSNPYALHPGLIDSCFQLLASCYDQDGSSPLGGDGRIYIPFTISGFEFYRSPSPHSQQLWCHAVLREGEENAENLAIADISLYDHLGQIVAEIRGFKGSRVEQRNLLSLLPTRAHKGEFQHPIDLYQRVWQLQKSRLETQIKSESEEPGVRIIFTGLTKDDMLVNGDSDRYHDRAIKIAKALSQQLQAVDETVVLVFWGDCYENLDKQDDGNNWVNLNPVKREDFDRLLKESSLGKDQTFRSIVHLNLSQSNGYTQTEQLQAQQQTCGAILHLTQALVALGKQTLPKLILVTRGAQSVRNGMADTSTSGLFSAPLWGMGTVLAEEQFQGQCRCLDLDPIVRSQGSSEDQEADHVGEAALVLGELWRQDGETQVAFRDGKRYVARVVRNKTAQDKRTEDAAPQGSYYLESFCPGLLNELKLRPALRCPPRSDQVEIEVRATGLNFRDVLTSLGMYPGEPAPLGGECAGHIVAIGPEVKHLSVGMEVIALSIGVPSFSRYVTVPAALVMPKPEHLSFEDAATIPIAFLTAYYGLHSLAKMKPGERILIHAAAGGVGLAAVALAQAVGANVFATAGSESKREYLQSLGVEYVMNSRSTQFCSEILSQTQGEGVDIVLNSLNEDFIPKSLETLKFGGRFIELGKRGAWDAEEFSQVRPDVYYATFDLVAMTEQDPAKVKGLFEAIMSGFQSQSIKPLPYQSFELAAVESAFRYMAQAKHIGKVIVHQPLTPLSVAQPKIGGSGTYLITGGLGALGLRLAKWLVNQGARSLVLLSRRSPNVEAQQAIETLQQEVQSQFHQHSQHQELEQELGQELDIIVETADVTEPIALAEVFDRILARGQRLRGVIHAAGVLDDGLVTQQSWEQFEQVLRPKTIGAWNLHLQTQRIPLDFFLLFSSAASLLGNAGQAAYAAGNAFLDTLAHHRQSLGLAATSINWGPWEEIGMAAKMSVPYQERLKKSGIFPLTPNQALEKLEEILQQNTAQPDARQDVAAQVMAVSINWSDYRHQELSQGRTALLKALLDSSELQNTSSPRSQAAGADKPPTRLRSESPQAGVAKLSGSLAPAPLVDNLKEQIIGLVAKVVGLKTISLIDMEQPLRELGLDSLMAVELTNALSKLTGTVLPSTLVFDYPTINALYSHLNTDLSPPSSSEDSQEEIKATGANTSNRELETEPETGELLQSNDLADLAEDELAAMLDQKVEDIL